VAALAGLQSDACWKTKKPTHRNPENAGFDCVGLLANGSPGRRPDYPLISHPRDFDFSYRERLHLRLHRRLILCRLIGEANEYPKNSSSLTTAVIGHDPVRGSIFPRCAVAHKFRCAANLPIDKVLEFKRESRRGVRPGADAGVMV
jgi:hypothetical protein